MKVKIYLWVLFLIHFISIPSSGFSEETPTGNKPVAIAFSSDIGDGFFAAVVNSGDNTVSVYRVNSATGVYTAIAGFAFATGLNPKSVDFSPEISGNFFVAVANAGEDTLSIFRLNAVAESFTLVDTPKTGNHPQSVAFSPILVGGKLLAAVANFRDDTVTFYKVNTSTGGFKKLGTRCTGRRPDSVAFSPELGCKLYATVANSRDNTLSVFNVNSKNGLFKNIGTTRTGKFPVAVTFSPNILGKLFAVSANYNENTISVFKVNPRSGGFRLVGTLPVGIKPVAVEFTSIVNNNLYFAVANEGSSNVFLYTFNLAPTIFPPENLEGFRECSDNVLTWQPPVQGDPVVLYRVYRNNFDHFLGQVSSDQPLRFVDPNAKVCKRNIYYVVSVNAEDEISTSAKVVIE